MVYYCNYLSDFILLILDLNYFYHVFILKHFVTLFLNKVITNLQRCIQSILAPHWQTTLKCSYMYLLVIKTEYNII